MGKRRTREQIQRLLRELDRDQIDDARRVRELQVEVERLKLLVAELLLDKRMLQDVAKKKW